MSERKFIQQTPFTNGTDAARIVRRIVRDVGTPAHVWYVTDRHAVRVCAPDYQGEGGEVLVGVYGPEAKLWDIARDIKEVRGEAAATVKRTRSVTVSETVETTTFKAETERLQAALPPPIEVEPEPVAEAPAAIVAPLPAILAPDPKDAYGAAVWELVAQRDAVEARIAELQLLRFLFDRNASDRLAFLLEDYVEFCQGALECMDDGEDYDTVAKSQADAREWAKRFALQQANERSIFTRAAKQLRDYQNILADCGSNDTSKHGDDCRADEKECSEIASIFEFAAIKRST